LRALWGVVCTILFRPSPKFAHGWRRLLLRVFGARIERGAVIHPSVKIWAPWNLAMAKDSCLGPAVDCYNVAPIELGRRATVSQYSLLCAATHDFTSLQLPLVTSPITIQDFAWVCADVFVGPGVTVGEGAVVGARSSVYKNVEPWTVVAGNPARFMKARILGDADEHQRPHTHVE
jgi:putative colanic acid biosynthesis acetyltransferase WcaF